MYMLRRWKMVFVQGSILTHFTWYTTDDGIVILSDPKGWLTLYHVFPQHHHNYLNYLQKELSLSKHENYRKSIAATILPHQRGINCCWILENKLFSRHSHVLKYFWLDTLEFWWTVCHLKKYSKTCLFSCKIELFLNIMRFSKKKDVKLFESPNFL